MSRPPEKRKPDIAVFLPPELMQTLGDLAGARKQTVVELLDKMILRERKDSVVRVPSPDPVGAVRSGRSQDYVRPGYNGRQRPETEAEKKIYFGE